MVTFSKHQEALLQHKNRLISTQTIYSEGPNHGLHMINSPWSDDPNHSIYVFQAQILKKKKKIVVNEIIGLVQFWHIGS